MTINPEPPHPFSAAVVGATMGDMGFVRGQRGYWVVSAGAPPPENFEPCNRAAREAAESSEALTVYQPGTGTRIIWRGDFFPLTKDTSRWTDADVPQEQW